MLHTNRKIYGKYSWFSLHQTISALSLALSLILTTAQNINLHKDINQTKTETSSIINKSFVPFIS